MVGTVITVKELYGIKSADIQFRNGTNSTPLITLEENRKYIVPYFQREIRWTKDNLIISLNVSREEIYELQEEILDMEVIIYSYEDILYKNPMDMTDDEKKTYKKLKELEKRYNKFESLKNLFSYYLAFNGKEI